MDTTLALNMFRLRLLWILSVFGIYTFCRNNFELLAVIDGDARNDSNSTGPSGYVTVLSGVYVEFLDSKFRLENRESTYALGII